jgi:hypothetical protein
MVELDYLTEVLAFQDVEHFKSFLGYFGNYYSLFIT